MSGPLANQRHEMFCQYVAQGKPASVAYAEAGYAPNDGNAIRLKGNERIKARIQALQTRIAEKITTAVAVDKTYILNEAHSLQRRISKELDVEFTPAMANVAVRSVELLGRHVDVQAWKDTQDVNVNLTVDQAISRLAQAEAAIEGEFEVVGHDAA